MGGRLLLAFSALFLLGFSEPRVEVFRKKNRYAEIARDRFQVDRKSVSRWPLELSDTYLPMDKSTPEFHALHYRVQLNFPAATFVTPRFNGQVDITFKPLKEGYQLLVLDSSGLEIQSVRLLDGFQELRFQQSEDKLEIDLGSPRSTHELLTVSIQYQWGGKVDRGIYYRSTVPGASVDSIYTQSEAEDSRFWFPANAHPNDRSTFETIVEMPKPLTVVSNGSLLDLVDHGASQTFHWSESFPMPVYLFTMTAGRFAVHREWWQQIPIEYYGPPETINQVVYSLRSTRELLTHFSEITGHRYAFEKYAQVVVPQYLMGGMEHTTATTLTEDTVHTLAEDEQYSSRGLLAHELAHQWFGDLMTCRSWDHLWLNEGFATYFDALNEERLLGEAGMLQALEEGADWYFSEEDLDPRPVVFPYYKGELDSIFDSRAYAKGAWVLHMLRKRLGDSKFFEGVRFYIGRHQGTLVETDDFRKSMEESSKEDLKEFFDQWLMQPGYPQFQTSWSYDEKKQEIELRVKQVRNSGGKIFRGKMGIEVDGKPIDISISSIENLIRLSVSQKPAYVKFNSRNEWLAKITSDQSSESWESQLTRSLDPAARIEAAMILASTKPSEKAMELIKSCSLKDPEIWVRTRCIDSIGVALETHVLKRKERALVQWTADLLEKWSHDSHWKIRHSAAKILQILPFELAYPFFVDLIYRDPAVAVVEAALESLAGFPGDTRAYSLLVSQVDRPSFQNRIFEAVLKATGSLRDSRAVSIAIRGLSSQFAQKTRMIAIHTLAKVGSKMTDSTIVLEALEAQLHDRYSPIQISALLELANLRNRNSIPAIEELAKKTADHRVRWIALEVIRVIKSGS